MSIIEDVEDVVVQALEAGAKLPKEFTLNLDGLEHCGLKAFSLMVKVGKHRVLAQAGQPEPPMYLH